MTPTLLKKIAPQVLARSTGAQRIAPTITSEPRGSLTIARRHLSCSEAKRARRCAMSPLPRSGAPLTTTRVGSPPVCESTMRIGSFGDGVTWTKAAGGAGFDYSRRHARDVARGRPPRAGRARRAGHGRRPDQDAARRADRRRNELRPAVLRRRGLRRHHRPDLRVDARLRL